MTSLIFFFKIWHAFLESVNLISNPVQSRGLAEPFLNLLPIPYADMSTLVEYKRKRGRPFAMKIQRIMVVHASCHEQHVKVGFHY